MKLYIAGVALTQVLLFSAAMADHPYVDPYALEPSINGGVSASGLFASQAEEDAYLADQQAMELEPCINGDVSTNGLFASQAEEDVFTGAIAAN